MKLSNNRPNLNAVLQTLKDFQRATVDHVFRRLYLDEDYTRRFLVADEVGLGKTLVARGVLARVVDYLWDRVDRIDVVYICSNTDIARQNLNRLRLPGLEENHFTLASRITLLPITVSDLEHSKVTLISFTPGTSFNLRSSLGIVEERALLYWLLNTAWELSGTGPLNVLQGNVEKDRFREIVRSFAEHNSVDPTLREKFILALNRRSDLKTRFQELCQRFRYARKYLPEQDAKDRAKLIGELRALLAATSLKVLQPDFIILDEFQRFKGLLTGNDEASQLARELFDYTDEQTKARLLLLSATPYRMYTTAQQGEEDHYVDFMDTVRFLLADSKKAEDVDSLLREYRRALYHIGMGEPQALEQLRQLKGTLEMTLRRVMVRTERLAVTEDRNGMLVQVPDHAVKLDQADLMGYLELQKIADLIDGEDVLRYWKTAPYLLNFMDEYKLKKNFGDALSGKHHESKVAQALAKSNYLLFPWNDWRVYARIDPRNARLRWLVRDMLDRGVWRLLWIPPSLPYYQLGKPFADPACSNFTKRLIFSSWRVVPKVIAAFLSYDAERRMIRSFGRNPANSPEARKRRRSLLRFARSEGRLTGMPVLALLYPSVVLADKVDPLTIAARIGCSSCSGTLGEPALKDVLKAAEVEVQKLLPELSSEQGKSGPEDESWYWAAPILLDLKYENKRTLEWFSTADLAEVWSAGSLNLDEDTDSNWLEHVKQAQDFVAGHLALGRPPADLPSVLAKMALAGPGVVALRALYRTTGSMSIEIQKSAAHVAWAFRSLFNLPEVMSLLRGLNNKAPYWQCVLEYGVNGCLQAVLDEYVHVLYETLGLPGKEPEVAAKEMAESICAALTIRTVNLTADEIREGATKGTFEIEARRMRARFALRFSDDRSDDNKSDTRAAQVREAFNSPFWPFVLATTSVGQEGLDFHPYCHAVVHWDLPSNPADLEQREGRVHRYKGHAVRKNLARKYGKGSLLQTVGGTAVRDPWTYMFSAAQKERDRDLSDLVPFWVFPVPEGARIERHVPVLPLSRESEWLTILRRSLAFYRMVFGQPRQEDLLAYLLENLACNDVKQILGELRIDLAPPQSGNRPGWSFTRAEEMSSASLT